MRIRLTVALGALVLALSGCVPTAEPDPIPPTPTVTPVFATEEEALAAAEAAYREYLAVSDAIFHDGGNEPERLESVATGPFLAESVAGFIRIGEQGLRSLGSARLESIRIQQFEADGSITAYLCDDVSEIDVINEQGESVVSGARPPRTMFEVSFDYSEQLMISSRQVWGDGGC
jgi:hypothetical protein